MRDIFGRLALAATIVFGLSGCVVVISDDGIEAGSEARWEGSRDDAALATRVRDALRDEKSLELKDLKVRAHDGVVTLHGAVQGTERLERTIAIARATPGAEKVISRLRVEVD